MLPKAGDRSGTFENLALITSLEMLGFIVLEVAVWILIAAGILPGQLILRSEPDFILQISTAYLVIGGLLAVLVAGFWLAVLTEVFGIVEINEVKVKV
jgi:hypothetical protein